MHLYKISDWVIATPLSAPDVLVKQSAILLVFKHWSVRPYHKMNIAHLNLDQLTEQVQWRQLKSKKNQLMCKLEMAE